MKKPYAIVRATKDDNPLLNAMFGYNNSYIATFNILLTVSQKEIDDEEFDINECFKKFKKLVSENADNFKCYDFTISELTESLCQSVLIISTKQTMATRRVLSLTDKESAFVVTKQAVLTAIAKKRYKPLSSEDLEKLQDSQKNDESDDEKDNEED